MPLGEMTAMSVFTPSLLPRLTVTLRMPGLGLPAITSAAIGRQRGALLQVEQLLELLGPRGERALFLQPDLEVGELPFQRFVFGARAPQPDVVAPAVPAEIDDRGEGQLDARKDAERHRLEHRHAGTRLDLRGDENEMPDQHQHEQHTGALAERLSPLKFQHVASYQLPATS